MRALIGVASVLCLLALPVPTWSEPASMAPAAEPDTCTYNDYNWNTRQRKAVNYRVVRKPYSERTGDEIDRQSGCSVCQEDQVEIRLPSLEPFRACHKLAPRIESTLRALIAKGEPIESVTGYRVGRTRNPLDDEGNRTGFSNHSYGIALDVNRSKNGLYGSCPTFGPSCRLIMGGEWKPEVPGTLVGDGAIVQAFEAAGFRWGGEIAGSQKDFMHFSPTGY